MVGKGTNIFLPIVVYCRSKKILTRDCSFSTQFNCCLAWGGGESLGKESEIVSLRFLHGFPSLLCDTPAV